MKIVKRLTLSIVIVLVLIVPAITYSNYLAIPDSEKYSDTTQYTHEYTQVQGTVLSKEHKDLEVIHKEHWTFGGTRSVPQVIPEYNHITIGYGDITTTIDSITLYNQVEVGSIINITLHQVYDSNHNMIEQYLELPV